MFLLFIIILFICIALICTNNFCNGAIFMIGGLDKIKNLKTSPRSKSEFFVVSILEELTKHKFPTVNPGWLIYNNRSLELDGYCKNLKIALEFSGPLHTKWTPTYETYKTYITRVCKDITKINLCKKHNVYLIVVDMSLPPHHWRDYLKSRLFDCKFIKEKPITYIEKQIAEPFRNLQLEKELNIKVPEIIN